MSEQKNQKNATFEEALAELQKLVGELEGGKLPLSESLSVYERAIALSTQCTKMLEEAEQKITLLSGGDDEVPFDLAVGEDK
ncbi:MAG: exodeoxyribonuclease VII small subunit [Clostridia bacterium]|nr:exodeoxyribonuclease VII small subunit [Clostridia bacterium]